MEAFSLLQCQIVIIQLPNNSRAAHRNFIVPSYLFKILNMGYLELYDTRKWKLKILSIESFMFTVSVFVHVQPDISCGVGIVHKMVKI